MRSEVNRVRLGPERTGTPFRSFFDDRNAVPVVFHAAKRGSYDVLVYGIRPTAQTRILKLAGECTKMRISSLQKMKIFCASPDLSPQSPVLVSARIIMLISVGPILHVFVWFPE